MKDLINEKVSAIFIVLSILALVTGFVLACFSVYIDSKVADLIASYCLLLCFVPFISLQFFLSAGLRVAYFNDIMVIVKILLYIILFPAANVWFIVWLDTFWHFIPALNSLSECGGEVVKISTIFYLIINGLGLLTRFLIFQFKKYQRRFMEQV